MIRPHRSIPTPALLLALAAHMLATGPASPAGAQPTLPDSGVIQADTPDPDRLFYLGEITTFQMSNPTLPIALMLERTRSPVKDGEGSPWVGRFDIPPDTGIGTTFNMRIDLVRVTQGRIEFVQPSPRGGNLFQFSRENEPGMGRGGGWSAGALSPTDGQELPLRMWRVSEREWADAVPRRPQLPGPTVPYERRPVEFTVSDLDPVALRGELTLPSTIPEQSEGKTPRPNRVPAAILVSDGGPHDRDHTQDFHQPFLVLADALTRAGIAVLRLDDRTIGTGGAPATFVRQSVQSVATDALAAAAWLGAQPEIDPARIALIGLGEGAAAAAQAVHRLQESGDATVKINALGLLSPPALPGKDLAAAEFAHRLTVEGETHEFTQERTATYARAVASLAAPEEVLDRAAALEALEAELRAQQKSRRLPQPEMDDPQINIAAQGQFDSQVQSRITDWYAHDPRPALCAAARSTRLRILVITGGRDAQFPARQNLPALREALGVAAGPAFDSERMTYREFPGLNHRLQPALTGFPDEYMRLSTTIAPEVLSAISTWLLASHPPPSPDSKGTR